MVARANARAKAAKTAERIAEKEAAPPTPAPTPKIPKEERPARDRAKAVESFANKLKTGNLEDEMTVDPDWEQRDHQVLASKINPISPTDHHAHFLNAVVRELQDRVWTKSQPLPDDPNEDPIPIGWSDKGKRSPYEGANKFLRQASDAIEDHYSGHANNQPLTALHHLVKAADNIQNAHEEIRRVDKKQGGFSVLADSARFNVEPAGNERGLWSTPIQKNSSGLSIHDRLSTVVNSYKDIVKGKTTDPNILSNINQITRSYAPGQQMNASERYDFAGKSDEEMVSDMRDRNRGRTKPKNGPAPTLPRPVSSFLESKTDDIAEDDATKAEMATKEFQPPASAIRATKTPSEKQVENYEPLDFDESDEERQARYSSTDVTKIAKSRAKDLGLHFDNGRNAGI